MTGSAVRNQSLLLNRDPADWNTDVLPRTLHSYRFSYLAFSRKSEQYDHTSVVLHNNRFVIVSPPEFDVWSMFPRAEQELQEEPAKFLASYCCGIQN